MITPLGEGLILKYPVKDIMNKLLYENKHVALVEPNWKFKSPRWKKYMNARYLPIGLLKLATLARSKFATVELLREGALPSKRPDFVFITSLFTYWHKPVWETVRTYKMLYPDAHVVVGGVYASIMPDHCAKSGCDQVVVGLVDEAENLLPAYDLIPECKFNVVHASRGCTHRCRFCHVYKLEPKYIPKRTIRKELVFPHTSFLDNNLLANPHIEHILEELIESKTRGSYCLSGVEANLVTEQIALLMREAKFRDIRIAFDRADEEGPCRNAIELFEHAGYKRKEIAVFMLYNFEDPFDEVEKRRLLVGKWGSQIISQRYIPIPSLVDTFLHPNWTEGQCRLFARNCRQQSICMRFCSVNPFQFFKVN